MNYKLDNIMKNYNKWGLKRSVLTHSVKLEKYVSLALE